MKILLCGKPNVGKSTLFNRLTHKEQKISNWAGTTVGIRSALLKGHKTSNIEITDIPGLQELSYNLQDNTIEQTASNYLLQENYDLILNVIDVSNLEANLLLTLDLLSLKVPTIIVLNMMDVAKTQKICLDIQLLEILLGTKVITISAKKNQGLKQLKNTLTNFNYTPSPKLFYGQGIDKELTTLQTKHEVFNFFHQLKTEQPKIFYNTKARLIKNIQIKCIKQGDYISITDILDNFLLNKYLGLPIFILIMYSLFTVTLSVGSILQTYFDDMGKLLLVDTTHFWLNKVSASPFLHILLADAIGGSIQVVVSFFPILFVFFFLVSVLEHTGYMARIVFLLDKMMNTFGLNAKSIVPMIISFGCNVPAVMASRVVENPHQRKLIIFASHFVSCSARFSVYILFISVFFKTYGNLVLISLYLGGVALVFLTAYLFKKRSTTSEFYVVELPRYQIPPIMMITKSSIARLQSFINRAGKIIIPIVTLITIANSFTFHGLANQTNKDSTILVLSGKFITPVLHPIGIAQDNWSASVAIITGILAKETVVATLQSIYNNEDTTLPQVTLNTLKEDFHTANNNLITSLLPQSNNNSNSQDIEDYQEISGVMHNKFTPISAFAFLLFFMIYSPCTSALGSLKTEVGNKIMIKSFLWSTSLAYIVATLFYQTATFFENPLKKSIIIGSILAVIVLSLQKPFKEYIFKL
ncbi:Fe(2+) transporter FeoB [Candidatus Hepatincola sp. Pdp]